MPEHLYICATLFLVHKFVSKWNRYCLERQQQRHRNNLKFPVCVLDKNFNLLQNWSLNLTEQKMKNNVVDWMSLLFQFNVLFTMVPQLSSYINVMCKFWCVCHGSLFALCRCQVCIKVLQSECFSIEVLRLVQFSVVFKCSSSRIMINFAWITHFGLGICMIDMLIAYLITSDLFKCSMNGTWGFSEHQIWHTFVLNGLVVWFTKSNIWRVLRGKENLLEVCAVQKDCFGVRHVLKITLFELANTFYDEIDKYICLE